MRAIIALFLSFLLRIAVAGATAEYEMERQEVKKLLAEDFAALNKGEITLAEFGERTLALAEKSSVTVRRRILYEGAKRIFERAGDGERAWLSARPYVWGRSEFACAHSEFSSPSDWFYILQPKDAWQSLWTRSEQILFVGHTHIPRLMKIPADKVRQAQSFDEKEAMAGMMGLKEIKSKSCKIVPVARYVVNVGSVGLPRKGSRASYCVYDSRNHELQLVYLK